MGRATTSGDTEPQPDAEPQPYAEDDAEPQQASRFWRLSEDDEAALRPFLGQLEPLGEQPVVLFDRPVYEYLPVTYDDGSTGHRLVARRRAYFTRDDGRLFWITFGATVAGTVGTVMIVAVAVILAKSGISRLIGRLDVGAVIAAIFLMAFGGALAGAQVHFLRKRTETDRMSSFGMWLVVIIYGVGSLLIALTLLGYAVGIR